jgi:OOP family OmpA-OmpF porin
MDPDQLASMLEAIDSFAREALAPQPSGVHVGRIKMGDLDLWVERAPYLAVAAIVRGPAPAELGEVLRETRERIYLAHQSDVAQFVSDVTPFAAARPLLEQCLATQRREAPRRAHVWLALGSAGLAMLLAILALQGYAHASAVQRQLSGAVAALSAEPGIIVTNAERVADRDRIRGLRDPLASAPANVLREHGLPDAELHFAPYYSLDPEIVELRASEKLDPPDTVTLDEADGVLHAGGVAPRAWITKAEELAPQIAGIERYDDGALRPREAVDALRSAAATLERVEIFFRGASTVPDAAGSARAIEAAQELVRAAPAARMRACVSVVGHTDPTGPEARHHDLSEARAKRVAADLIAHGIAPDLVSAAGAGIRRDAPDAIHARAVTFHVDVGCGEEQS